MTLSTHDPDKPLSGLMARGQARFAVLIALCLLVGATIGMAPKSGEMPRDGHGYGHGHDHDHDDFGNHHRDEKDNDDDIVCNFKPKDCSGLVCDIYFSLFLSSCSCSCSCSLW